LFADAEFGHTPSKMSYDLIPSAVFTSPEMGSVGLTEAEAIEQFGAEAIQTHCSRFVPMYYTLTPLKSKGSGQAGGAEIYRPSARGAYGRRSRRRDYPNRCDRPDQRRDQSRL
jgi:hypothetical protein